MAQKVVRGTVKWFDERKGYGFAEVPNQDDVFVHYSEIDMDGFKTLLPGQPIEFYLEESKQTGKMQACGVRKRG